MLLTPKDITSLIPPSVVIGKYVKLRLVSRGSLSGLCPFHNEKTPSFRVNDDKRFYYCFGCGKGGDIFNFLQDYKSISFVEALKEVAQENGLNIQTFNFNQNHEAKEVKSLLTEVKHIFHNQLKSASGMQALKYLTEKRRLSMEVIESFEIGFAPREGDFLLSYLPEKIEALVKLGLVGKREGGDFYNPFAERIMFPIHDSKGEVVGFGGRIYTRAQEEAKLAKYINSKESEAFKKNQIIYGLEKLKKPSFPPILVEGYLDVITMHQFGFKSAVAQMGTALSELQIKTLFSKGDEIIFCYDKDEAGKKAEVKSIEIALSIITPQKTLSFINFTQSKDADELLNKFGKEEMQKAIEARLPLHAKIFNDFAGETDFKDPNQVSLLEQKLIEFCLRIANEIIRKNYLSYFKDRIYKSKFQNKKPKIEAPLFNQSNFKTRDAILYLLLKAHPFLKDSDFYNENFIPFSSESAFNQLERNSQAVALPFSIPILTTEDEVKEFYLKIYKGYLGEKLKQEVAIAIKEKDFAKAKTLKEEMEKLICIPPSPFEER